MYLSKKGLKGFTLVEMLIALTINAFIFIVLFYVFAGNLQQYSTSINRNKLNRQVESTLQLIAKDIRRAGYWSNAANDIGTGTNSNPFMSTTAGADIATTGSCITLTYDHNLTGTMPAISSSADDDRYGYRLLNGAVQARPRGAAFSCSAPASAWENVTDTAAIVITNLSFTLNTQTLPVGSGTGTLSIRSVDISITGRLASDANVTLTLTQNVKIRNDKFNP